MAVLPYSLLFCQVIKEVAIYVFGSIFFRLIGVVEVFSESTPLLLYYFVLLLLAQAHCVSFPLLQRVRLVG